MAATTAAIIGITSSAIGAGMSFGQMAKQSKAAAAARQQANLAIQEAKQRAEQNVFESLSLTKDPYERAREAAIVSGAQAIEAGRESERGAAATAGRVAMAQNEMQRDIADVQAKEIQNLNQLVAAEESRLKDYAANISLAEAEGAQKAMRDAEILRAQAGAQAFQQLGQVAEGVDKLVPLYKQSQGAKAYTDLVDQATAAGLSQEQLQNKLVELSATSPELAALSGVGYSAKSVDAKGDPIANAMTPVQFQDYLSQRPDLIKNIIGSDLFAKPKSVVDAQGRLMTKDLGYLNPDLLNAYGLDPFSIAK